MDLITKSKSDNQVGNLQPTMLPRRVSWHTAQLNGAVWCERRGAWREATITHFGRERMRVRFDDTGNGAFRGYGECYHRNVKFRGADKPADSKREEVAV